MADYVLVGGGAFARELHDWFTPALVAGGNRFIGYLDDGDQPMRGTGHDLPQLGTIAGYRPNAAHRLVMAVASPQGKQKLVADLGAERFATLVHPTAWVSASARIGRGAVIGVFADISANAVVGDFSTVNGYGSVGHDAELGEFATISGYVDLTGYVKVGRASFLGSGARVLPHLSLGERCTVGAGAVVVRSVGSGVTLYAAPARVL
jgi:sugar O-acyltransferase (sialic acid O-acetyltransferase NeuD family)